MAKLFRIVGYIWISAVVGLGILWGVVGLIAPHSLPAPLDFLANFGGIYLLAVLAAPGIGLIWLGNKS